MTTLIGKSEFISVLRELQSTDPKHPDTWNPNYQKLLNNTVYLKQFSDEVAQARGGSSSLNDRISGVEQTHESLNPEFIDQIAATVKFALDQSGVANKSVGDLRHLSQQEGQITIKNRGVIQGCVISKSATAARNLNLSNGVCFYGGRSHPVNPGDNAASVPSNTGSGSVVVYAYLYLNSQDVWKLAVTPIGSPVPAEGITIYRLTIPANSTDATDPNLTRVGLTDVRRMEAEFPQLFDNFSNVSVPIKQLRASDYRLDFDVVSHVGAPCDATRIMITSRATNGFSLALSSAADDVVVRWRASKLNN